MRVANSLVSEINNFHRIRNSHSLQQIILPEGQNEEEELREGLQTGIDLSPRDSWETNGILDNLHHWSQAGCGFMWVGGTSGSRGSWVTSLSANVVHAFQSQPITVLFVFCQRRNGVPMTVMTLLRRLVAQLFERHPELPYRYAEQCSEWRLKQARTFDEIWPIFETLAGHVSRLFIVLDRVEECEVDVEGDLKGSLLPSLVKLAQLKPRVSVIATSIFYPPKEIEELGVMSSYIDTSKKISRR